MPKDNMMKSVQSQKLLQSIERICQFHAKKQQFFKLHMPIHQTIIKKAEIKSNQTLILIQYLDEFVKDQKEMQAFMYEKCQKSTLFVMAKDKKAREAKQSKQDKSKVSQVVWARNLVRLQQAMGESQIERVAKIKNFYKALENIQKDLNKEETRYRDQIKKAVKQLNRQFDLIDELENQQTKLIAKMIKDSKNLDKNDSMAFLIQYKKLQGCLDSEIKCIAERGQQILKFLKAIIANQKQVAKKLKQHMSIFANNKKQFQTKLQSDEKMLGLISMMQENVQENCEKCFQQILSEEQLTIIQTIAASNKNSLATIVAYLKQGVQGYRKSLDIDNSMRTIGACMTFKNWGNVSLAGGWFITTYTPAEMYLTYDHYIGIFDLQGKLMKKIHSTNTKIDRVGEEQSIVYLVQVVKGFFSDSKQEYKVKFDDPDRLQEFQLFMENQIQV